MSNPLEDTSFNSDTLDELSDTEYEPPSSIEKGKKMLQSFTKARSELSILSEEWGGNYSQSVIDGSVMAMSLHESKYSHREETEESPLNILKSAILSLSKIDNCDLSEPITILQGLEEILENEPQPNFSQKFMRSSFQGIANSTSFHDHSSLNNSSSFLDNELEQQQEYIKNLIQDFNSFKEEKKELEGKYDALVEEMNRVSEENLNLKVQNQSLLEENRTAFDTINQLNESLNNLTEKNNELLSELNNEKSKNLREMNILRQSLKELSEKIEKSESEYNLTIKNLQDAKLKIVEQENELNKLKALRNSTSFVKESIQSEGVRIQSGILSDSSSDESDSSSEFSVHKIGEEESEEFNTEDININDLKFNKKNFLKLKKMVETSTSSSTSSSLNLPSTPNSYEEFLLKSQISDLESELSEYKLLLSHKTELYESKLQEISDLTLRYNEKQQELLDLEEKFNLINQQNSIKILDTDAELEILKDSVIQYTLQISNEEKKNSLFKKQINELRQQLQNASLQSLDLTQQQSIDENDLLFLKNENEILKNDINHIKEESANIEKLNKNYEDEIFQNKLMLQQLLNKIISLQNHINSISSSFTNEVELKFQHFKDKIFNLTTQIAILQRQLKKSTTFTSSSSTPSSTIIEENDIEASLDEKNKIFNLENLVENLNSQLQQTLFQLEEARSTINRYQSTINQLEEKINSSSTTPISITPPFNPTNYPISTPPLISPEELHNLKSSLYATETRCHQLSLEHAKLFSHSLRIIIYLESECIRLKNLGDHFKSSNAKLHHDITRLSSLTIRLKLEENNSKSLNKKLLSLKNTNEKLTETINKLNSKLLMNNNTNEREYEHQLSILREENEKYFNENQENKKEIELLQTQLNLEKNTSSNLLLEKENEIRTLTYKFDEITSQYNNLKLRKPLIEDKNEKNKINQLENQLKEMNLKLQNEQQLSLLKINELESKNKSLASEINLKISIIDSLEKQISNLNFQSDKNDTTMFDLQSNYATLLKKCGDYDLKFHQLTERNKQLEEENSKNLLNLSNLQLQFKDLTYKYESSNEEILLFKTKNYQEIIDKYSILETKYDESVNKNYELTSELSKIETEYHTLTENYQSILINYQELQDRCSSLQATETVYLTELNSLKKRIELLTTKLQENEVKLLKSDEKDEEILLKNEELKRSEEIILNYKKSEEFFVQILKKWNEFFRQTNKKLTKENLTNFDFDTNLSESETSLNLYQLADFSLELTQLKLNFKELLASYSANLSEKLQLKEEFTLYKYHHEKNTTKIKNYKDKYVKMKQKYNKKNYLLEKFIKLNQSNTNLINHFKSKFQFFNSKNMKNFITFLLTIKKFFENDQSSQITSTDESILPPDSSTRFSLPAALISYFNLNTTDPLSFVSNEVPEFSMDFEQPQPSPLSSPCPSDSEEEKTVNTIENNELELAFLSLTSSQLTTSPELETTIDSFSSFTQHQEVLLHYLQHLLSGFLADNKSLHSHIITLHNNYSANFNDFSVQKNNFILEIERLKEENKQLTNQMDGLVEKHNNYIKSSKESLDQIENLKTQVINLSQELVMTQNLNNEILSSYKSLEILYNETTNNFNLLKTEYDELIVTNKNYLNDLDELKKNISSKELKNEQLNTLLNRIRNERDMLSSIKKTLEIELDTLRNEKSSLIEDSLISSLNKIYLETETLCTHIDSCAELVDYVKDTPPPPLLADEESKLVEKNNEGKDDNEEKFYLLKNKIAFSIEKLIRLRYYLNKNNHNIKHNEKVISSYKLEINKLNESLKNSNEELLKLKSLNNSYLLDIKKKETDLTNMKIQYDDSLYSFEEIKETFNTLSQTVEELKTEKEKVERISHEINLKNQLANENIKILQDKNNQLENQIKDLNIIISRHEKENKNSTSKYDSLKLQYNSLYKEIQTIQHSFNKTELTITNTNTSVANVNRTKEEELEKQIQFLTSSLENKQNELILLKRKCANLEEESKKYYNEKESKQQIINKLEHNIKVISEEKISITQEISHIKQQVNEKSSTVNSLENIIKQLKIEKQRLLELLENSPAPSETPIKLDDNLIKNEDRSQIIHLNNLLASKNEEINLLLKKNKEFNLLINHYSNSLRNQGKKSREIIKEIFQIIKKFFNTMKLDVAFYQEINQYDEKSAPKEEKSMTRIDDFPSDADLDNILKPLPADFDFDFAKDLKQGGESFNSSLTSSSSFTTLKLEEALGVSDLYHFITQVCHLNSPYFKIQQELKKIKLFSSQLKKFSIENNNLKASLKEMIENQKLNEKTYAKVLDSNKKKIHLLEQEIQSLTLNQVSPSSSNDKKKENYEAVLEAKELQYQALMKEYNNLLVSYQKNLTKELHEKKTEKDYDKKDLDSDEKKKIKEEELLKRMDGLIHHNNILKQTIERLEVTCLQKIETIAEDIMIKYKNQAFPSTNPPVNTHSGSFHQEDLLKWEIYKNDLRNKIVTEMITIYRAGITNLFSDCKIISPPSSSNSSSPISCELFSLVGLHWMDKEIQTIQAGYESEINFQDLHIKELYQNIKNLNNFIYEIKKKYEEQLYLSYNSSSSGSSHSSSTSNLLRNMNKLIDEVNTLINYQEKEKKLHREQYSKIIEDLTQVLKRREQALLALKNLEEFNKKNNINISGYEKFQELTKEFANLDAHSNSLFANYNFQSVSSSLPPSHPPSHTVTTSSTQISSTHNSSTYKSSGTATLRTNH